MDFGTLYGTSDGEYDINEAYEYLDTFQIVAENKGAQVEYFSYYYEGGRSMAAFGFDDGTTGRFWNEVSDYYNTNCTNTCGTPRSELKTLTEFVDCTYNYTECIHTGYFKES